MGRVLLKDKSCPHCGAYDSLYKTEIANNEVVVCVVCGAKMKPEAKKSQTEITRNNIGAEAQAIYNKAICRVGAIFAKSPNADTGEVATCFSIGDGYYITNAHAVLDENDRPYSHVEMMIGNDSSDIYTAKVLFAKRECDLAIINSDCVTKAFNINLALDEGDIIYAIGNAKGEGLRMTEGINNGEEYIDDYEFPFIRHTASSVEGCSGGPVLNDNCDVVGVTCLSEYNWATCEYAIPSSELLKFISEFMANYNINIDINITC